MSIKQCVNCPGAVDHSTAECPVMRAKLMPCPFCGKEPAPYHKGVGCVTTGCIINGLHLDYDKWQQRASLPVGVPDEVLVELLHTAKKHLELHAQEASHPGQYKLINRIDAALNAAPAAPTVKAELVPTPEFVWVRLLAALAGDNGCPFTASTDDYREAKPALMDLIGAGFFRDDAGSLDGDIWTVAAGEQGEAAARFASCSDAYAVLSGVLNRVFDRPEEAPTVKAEQAQCSCVYATSENTPSVRKGYEVGGYLKEECQACAGSSAQQSAGERVSVDSGELSEALGRVSAGLETELAAINQLRTLLANHKTGETP